jgi:hypothetical protein
MYVKDAIPLVQSQTVAVTAEATRIKNGLATFAKFENERIDELNAVLRLEQWSIIDLLQAM